MKTFKEFLSEANARSLSELARIYRPQIVLDELTNYLDLSYLKDIAEDNVDNFKRRSNVDDYMDDLLKSFEGHKSSLIQFLDGELDKGTINSFIEEFEQDRV